MVAEVPSRDEATDQRAQGRDLAIRKGVWSGVFVRLFAILVSLVSVPIALDALGEAQYGALVLIAGLAALLPFADLGIGNGLVTALSRDKAADDVPTMARHATAAMVIATFASVVLLVLFLTTDPLVNWARLLGLGGQPFATDVDASVRVFAICFSIGIVGNMGFRILSGLQRTHIVNVWQLASPIVVLAGAWVGRVEGWSLPAFVAVLTGGPALVATIATLWVLMRAHPDLRPTVGALHRPTLVRLLRVSGLYLGLGVAAAVAFETDSLVLSWVLGPEAVTTYSVPLRVFSVVSILAAMALVPLWPAFSESLEAGDVQWARRTFQRSQRIAFLLGLVSSVVLAIMMEPILGVWVGGEVDPPTSLVVGLAVWTVLQVSMIPVSMLLNGAGVVGFQLVAASTMAVSNVILSVVLARGVGVAGPVWATVVAYTLCSVIPALWFISRRFDWRATDGGQGVPA